jgi:hypothetical protein
MAIKTADFHKHLRDQTENNCDWRYNDFPKPENAEDDAKLVGFAMLISQLITLRVASEVKALTRADIQVCIDEAMRAGKIEDKRTCMGANYYAHSEEK